MKKAELLARIEALEGRIRVLEALPAPFIHQWVPLQPIPSPAWVPNAPITSDRFIVTCGPDSFRGVGSDGVAWS